MACDFCARDVAVFCWQDIDGLVPAAPPIEPILEIPSCALLFRPQIDLPAPFSKAVSQLLASKKDCEHYAALYRAAREHDIPDDLGSYCSFSKLLGWPSLVQFHDLDDIGEPDDPKGLRLLLQVDDYSNGTDLMDWESGGSLYFLITEIDLRARRFERCEFDIQFT